MKTLVFLSFFATITVKQVSCKDYKLGVLLPYSYNDPDWAAGSFSAEYYAAALAIAVDRVNMDPELLPGSTLSFVWNNTQCNHTKMAQKQHWQIKKGVIGFIGPACYAKKAAKIAARHDLAVVSFAAQNHDLSTRKRHPNFARTNPTNYKSAFKILELLKAQGWRRVTIVYEADHKWRSFKNYLVAHLKKNGIRAVRRIKVHRRGLQNTIGSISSAMKSSSKQSDATLLLLPFRKTREVIESLERLKHLKQNPSHGFVGVIFDRVYVNSCTELPFKWFFSAYHYYSKDRFSRTERAFKRLLLVTIKPDNKETESYKAFAKELKERSSQKPFNSDVYKGCVCGDDGDCLFDKSSSKPPYSGAYLYDAVMQFARALHKVTIAGRKPTAKGIIKELQGSQFTGADGRRHEFDQNAEVKYDYTILGLKKDRKNRLNMMPLDSRNVITSIQ